MSSNHGSSSLSGLSYLPLFLLSPLYLLTLFKDRMVVKEDGKKCLGGTYLVQETY